MSERDLEPRQRGPRLIETIRMILCGAIRIYQGFLGCPDSFRAR